MSSTANPSGKGPRRLTAAARREAILDAAVEEFSRVGFHGATTARIAAGAACSEPTLYKHFASKRDLLLAALERAEQRVEAELDVIIAHDDQLPRFMRFVDTSVDYRHMHLLRMLSSALFDDTELREHVAAGTERLHERFRRGLAHGQARGRLRADADPEVVSWTWLGISLAACYGMLLEGEERFGTVMHAGQRQLVSMIAAPGAAPPAPQPPVTP